MALESGPCQDGATALHIWFQRQQLADQHYDSLWQLLSLGECDVRPATCGIDTDENHRSGTFAASQSINLLHRYELRTNPIYDSSRPMDQSNMPYDLPPVLQETIASPIRLHATTDMVLGPYGTAVWIDSHTEDYFNHADRGQRLAGRFCPVRVDEGEEIELSDQVATAAASSVYAFQEEDSWVQVAIDEVEGRMAVGSAENITVIEYI